ncbi:MAG: thioredoxin domain-containing protein [Deltaproteobacteria bacterium]|nr:thioredoxin domain-containing protein [Deltaproteobacteria bacterium]
MNARPPNRLAREKSPYLLQHAHNPVDWFPWGAEAFEKARREKKIVFLSIGYSTCHWCHVMERESFEDEKVAETLNSVCVSIKVDREERPDLDQVYMTVCQALTGSGGWPLNVLLTPEGTPFFAGTYFPKESRYGRIGLIELVARAGEVWAREPEKVLASGRDFVRRLTAATRRRGEGVLNAGTMAAAEEFLLSAYDEEHGGFGTAPKFPTPHNLTFLLRRYRRGGDPRLLGVVEATLTALADGGVFDQVGFGFHRYATDADWLVPHFEKMLYDQAGLAVAYVEAFLATGRPRWAEVVRRTLEYVLRDLRSPEGAFYSAEDADSEGVEGKFYVWTKREILDLLGPEKGERFCEFYGVTEDGNYEDEATGWRLGTNILHLPRRGPPAPDEPPRLPDWVEAARRRLFEARERRVRPGLDDKIITAWNGLTISALARAGRALGEETYLEAGRRAADFLWKELRPEDRLSRTYREGEAGIAAVAEDYAFLARAFLDLYEAGYDPDALRKGLQLARELVARFWDEQDEGLFDTASDAEALILRPKEVYDGAIPSANSVALEVFARLWLLTGDPGWEGRARATLDAFSGRVTEQPSTHTHFLQAASLLLEPAREVVVAGDPAAQGTRAFLSELASAYAPETASLLAREPLEELAPFTAGMKGGERPLAYVCEGFSCRAPLDRPSELAELLRRPPE